MPTEAELRAFACVAVGKTVPSIFYLARSPCEYADLGGVIREYEHPMVRSLRCVPERIDRETGVVDLTIIHGMTNARGRTLYGIPFKNPQGVWPFADEAGGTWHFITEV